MILICAYEHRHNSLSLSFYPPAYAFPLARAYQDYQDGTVAEKTHPPHRGQRGDEEMAKKRNLLGPARLDREMWARYEATTAEKRAFALEVERRKLELLDEQTDGAEAESFDRP